jgi:hypothetical protein
MRELLLSDDLAFQPYVDNLSSHTRKSVVERFGEKAGSWLWNRFTAHYTPKHGSWLNQAQSAISLFSRQCLGKRRIADRPSLRKDTRAWNRRMNRNRVPIRWEFTRKKARKTFGYTITRSRYWALGGSTSTKCCARWQSSGSYIRVSMSWRMFS